MYPSKRNRYPHGRTSRSMQVTHVLASLLLITVLSIWGCVPAAVSLNSDVKFPIQGIAAEIPFATPEVIRLHEVNLIREYIIGPGDILRIDIWNRPELSGEHLVGPYGHITLPILGEFKIGGNTREGAAKSVTDLYVKYYDHPLITVKIVKYMNNKVYVLGRVSNPGVIHFSGNATLLEALSMAGGLPTEGEKAVLSKCYVVRGKDQIIWIDLLQLLHQANTKLNVRLANNDIIYIPESIDISVFVMGEVENPGSYQISSSRFNLLDAINLASGPTEDANIKEIRLIRNLSEREGVKVIDLGAILSKGDFSQNYLLAENDIIYIPRKGIAEFNYFLRQINPFMKTFIDGSQIQNELND